MTYQRNIDLGGVGRKKKPPAAKKPSAKQAKKAADLAQPPRAIQGGVQRSTPVQTRGPLIDSLVERPRTPQTAPVQRPGAGATGTGVTAPPAGTQNSGGTEEIVTEGGTEEIVPPAGTQSIGGAVIPQGGNLIRLRGTAGAADLYYVQYEAYGIGLLYEIGTNEDLIAAFGANAIEQFSQLTTLSQESFDNMTALEMGTLDEILGSTESIQTMIARDLREAGMEDVPAWMRNDPQAMLIVMSGAKEGWSAGRIAQELEQTSGFKARHPGWDALKASMPGSTVLDLSEEYYDRETKITDVLRKFRGPDTPTDTAYVGGLIGTGWRAEGIAQVLEGERILKQTPGSLAALNAILAANGRDQVTEQGFLDIIRGNAEAGVYELINDANRQQALAAAGVDVTTGEAIALGEGSSSGVVGEGGFREGARLAALNIIANRFDLNAARFGVTREQIVQAAFGEAPGDVYDRLDQMARERSVAGEGLGGFSAYQDQAGRLRVAGLKGL